MIAFGAPVEDIARATSLAAETAFCAAAHDAAVQHAFWLLSQVPTAAASQDFAGELRRAGILIGSAPTLPEIWSALIEAVDRQSKWTKGRTDLGELAVLSAVESLSAVAGREAPTLFGPSSAPEDTRTVLRGFAKPARFALLSRDFFARLTRRYLDYYLSRELPKHVGLDRRFPTLSEHQEFEEALERHCGEVSVIVLKYSGQWFSKYTSDGRIEPATAGGFVAYGFEKIRRELEIRRSARA